MFGSKKQTPEERPPADPRFRSGLYGMAALYLVYLLYQIARPYLTGDPYGPTRNQFLLGVVILGGGAVFLGVVAWKLAHAPQPETPSLEERSPSGEEENLEDGPEN